MMAIPCIVGTAHGIAEGGNHVGEELQVHNQGLSPIAPGNPLRPVLRVCRSGAEDGRD